MASITGMTAGSLYAAASGKRMGGLASGLNTDELVESMTAGTRAKIAKAEQNKTKAKWKMDAYRSISSKLIAFQNKFTSYSSASNLRGSSIFSRSIITASGEFSKYVKASGSGNNAGNVTIAGVAQLARPTSYVSSSPVSSPVFESGEISDTTDVSKLAGQSISFKYNNKSFSITLDSTKDYNSMEDVVNEINLKLSKTDYNSEGKLDSQIKASYEDGKLKLDFASDAVRKTGNTLEVTGVSEGIKSTLGINKGAKLTKTKALTGKAVTDDDIKKAYDTKNMTEVLAEKKFTFSYNGKTTSITLGKAEELAMKGKDGKPDLSKLDMDKVCDTLQKELNDAFGSGRVKVSLDDNKLSFKTVTPNGADDATSVLALTSGDSVAMKALGMKNGASNRLNLTSALGDSGFNFEKTLGAGKINDYAVRIRDEISGQEYVIDKTIDGRAFDENTTIDEIIRAINSSDAKVEVTYLSTTDKFSITSKQDGASGSFSIISSPAQKDEDGNEIDSGTQFNLGEALFGKNAINGVGNVGTDDEGNALYAETPGQDAIIFVDFDGDGGEPPVQISRGSNTFDINGMTVTVTGTFNTEKEKDGDSFKISDVNEKVTFEAKADTDKLTETVKEMVEMYNEIIELSNKMVSEKPNRGYAPLTAEQKAEMSEEDIKNWNEKAQEGMLFNDIDLRNFTQEIRFLFGSDSESIAAWEKLGIKASSSYTDHGKLTFDESAFRAALESDLDGVKDMFTALEVSHVDENGKKVVTQKGGVMTNIKTIFDKYAGTEGATKGLFVQQAGAKESPLSMLDNVLQKQMDSYDDLIDSLNDKLEDEIEKYYNKFSKLETYISNMNSQSSWLSQQFGGTNG